MAFQAAVGTWFAVHILVRLPVGSRFGINHQALPIALRLETGDVLDDVEVIQSDGGALHVQCKTSATLGRQPDSPLAKTVGQVVRWVAAAKAGPGLPAPESSAAILAVRGDAPASLAALESACRAFDVGGRWAATCMQRNRSERDALALLAELAKPSWIARRGADPGEDDLADVARIFHIARFSMDEGDSDWREASRLLGRHLFGDDAAGEEPLRDLRGIVRDLIGRGAAADRDGLLRAMRQRGHVDTRSPRFDADVERLLAATTGELARLAEHGVLPIDGGIPIRRDGDGALLAAIREGSLLIVGEPGAGKTGALVHAAATMIAEGDTVVFLSVDRFPGVAKAEDLKSELVLDHRVVDVLGAMPSGRRKVLIIDALDAARGGPLEAMFAGLIEQVREQLANDWSIVASIRTFDLKNGRRFRAAFAGAPASKQHADPKLMDVRHFLISRLSPHDLNAVAANSAALAHLLVSAPARLVELLTNVFNLSLAAGLLDGAAVPPSFAGISTQSELIDAYEDARLTSTSLQRAAGAAAAAMITARDLAVRKTDIDHERLDDVISTGVLAEAGDLVSFAHHVLFDHVSGRFVLDWHNPTALCSQLACDASTALLLAPALRFAVERMFREDGEGRTKTWRLIAQLFDRGVDAVLCHVALRVVVENIETERDLAGLIARVAAAPRDPALAAQVRRLARFATMHIDASTALAPATALGWGRLAAALIASRERLFVDPARFLLRSLFDHADLADVTMLDVLGAASRDLLAKAWSEPSLAVVSPLAIEQVARSFGSDPAASRALLGRMLREPHFSHNADREATWLAKEILPIARIDPAFAVEIYAALYGQIISDQTASPMGGGRILRLTSTRAQDFELCHYPLATALGRFLEMSPFHGTRALIVALSGKAAIRRGRDDASAGKIDLGRGAIDVLRDNFEYEIWEQTRGVRRLDDTLQQFVGFLRQCDRSAYAACVAAASEQCTTGSVWTRLLGVGAERAVDVGDLLWSLFERHDLLEHRYTKRDAIRFVAAAWPYWSEEERMRFEVMALDQTRLGDEDARDRWRHCLGQLVDSLPADAFKSGQIRAMRSEFVAAAPSADQSPLETHPVGTNDSSPDAASTPLSQQLLDASASLRSAVRNDAAKGSRDYPALLWRCASDLLALLDEAHGVRGQALQQAWGRLGVAVDAIAADGQFVPGADDMPTLEALCATLRRLSESPYPELADEPMSTLTWSAWDVRVYAARAWMSMARRFAMLDTRIIDGAEAAVVDPVASVRLQVAGDWAIIGNAAPARMWQVAERIAAREADRDVLACFMCSMAQVIRSEPERCEALLIAVARRLLDEFAEPPTGIDHLQEAVGDWMAPLFVHEGRVHLGDVIAGWTAMPERFGAAIRSFIASLRHIVFAQYQPDCAAELAVVGERARQGLRLVVTRSTKVLGDAYERYAQLPEPQREATARRYFAAERVVCHGITELCFGAGAMGVAEGEEAGIPDAAAMARFLVDYADVLDCFADSRSPETQHQLVQLYEFLIPGNPGAVFGRLHALLVGRGAQQDYHYETLAVEVVVRMIKRYLADHRAIFDDEERRTQLVGILELFSDAGWADALQLLFDLPELLR